MNICDIDADSLSSFINLFTCILSRSVMPFLITLAVVAFIWGVIQYYLASDNEDKRKKGKTFILWGLIALFVMISVWGLVNLLVKTVDLNTTQPTIPSVSSSQ